MIKVSRDDKVFQFIFDLWKSSKSGVFIKYKGIRYAAELMDNDYVIVLDMQKCELWLIPFNEWEFDN